MLMKNSIAKTTPTIVFANEDIRNTLTKLVFIFPTNKKIAFDKTAITSALKAKIKKNQPAIKKYITVLATPKTASTKEAASTGLKSEPFSKRSV